MERRKVKEGKGRERGKGKVRNGKIERERGEEGNRAKGKDGTGKR